MKRITVIAGGRDLSTKNLPSWLELLASELTRHVGIQLVTARDPSSDLFVSLDLHLPSLVSSLSRQRCERALFVAEPRSIKPLQYRRSILRLFTHVFSPSSLYIFPDSCPTRPYSLSPWWPSAQNEAIQSRRRPAEIGMIAGDKVSFAPGQQYELRRRVIQDWPVNAPAVLHTSGIGWSRGQLSILKTYFREAIRSLGAGHPPKGFLESALRRISILDKTGNIRPFPGHQVEFLAQFEFALVIENEPTIVTEKFWQALEAGCIPLYFGPDLQKFGISKSCAISFGTLDELFEFRFINLSVSERDAIRGAGRVLLKQSGPYTYAQSVKSITRAIVDLLRT